VGTAFANRTREELEPLIGFFFNTLVIRSDLGLPVGSSELTFEALLARVRETTLDAHANQNIPFDQVVEAVHPERNPSYSPLFQVMFLMQNAPMGSLHLPGLEARPMELDYGVAKFDLTLSMQETSDGLQGVLEYNSDLFERQTADRMIERFTLLAGAFAENPHLDIATPEITTGEERTLLDAWNDTGTSLEASATIDGLIRRQARATPEATALICGEQQLTYADLISSADLLSAQLTRMGIGPGKRVGIHLGRSTDMVVTLLAVLSSGAAYVPLDPTYPRERLSLITENASLSLISSEQEALADSRVPVLTPNIDSLVGRAAAADSAPNLPAYMIYTSGSTGRPKGVIVTHANAVNLFTGLDRVIGRPRDAEQKTWLAVTSISFDISVLELFWTLSRGFRVVLLADPPRVQPTPTVTPKLPKPVRPKNAALRFGLMYFAADAGQHGSDKYRLLLEGARFADRAGFEAVWVPERHFHQFGGAFPNPAVAASAVAATTENVRIRAGSVVLPLHSPIRIAEEWSMVDNLSDGRVEISIASGWHPNDYVLAPDNFTERHRIMAEGIETVRALWRGESLTMPNGLGADTSVSILPRPVQDELTIWVTAAGNPETFRTAGSIGANVLTHFLGQNIRDLEQKITIYREARAEAGHDPETGVVTLMLHTFVGDHLETVRETVRTPFKSYLDTSFNLLRPMAETLELDPERDRETILEAGFTRYFGTSALMGTPDSCLPMLEKVMAIGVDEVACLIDFGVPDALVLEGLNTLETLYRMVDQTPVREEEPATRVRQPTYQPPEDLISRWGVTHMQGTPATARMLMDTAAGREALASLECLCVGGEALPDKLAQQLGGVMTGKLFNMYGPTETTVWSSIQEVTGPIERSVPIGKPIANTRFQILDTRMRRVPLGVPGELFIGGDGVTVGYHERPALTAQRFLPDPFSAEAGQRLYRTGDRVSLRNDRELAFLGRLDTQIKLRGYRIELGEIESHLEQHPEIDRGVAVISESRENEARLVAFASSVPGSTEQAGLVARVKAFLEKSLPQHMVPSQIVFLDRLPLTPNGKIDRKALPERDPAEKAPSRFSAPRGDTEKALAALWAELLEIDQISRQTDFFEAGGHSMLIPKLHEQMKAKLSLDLTIADIFKYPVLSDMAAFIAQRTAPEQTATAKAQVRGGRAKKQLEALRRKRQKNKE